MALTPPNVVVDTFFLARYTVHKKNTYKDYNDHYHDRLVYSILETMHKFIGTDMLKESKHFIAFFEVAMEI